MLAVGASSGITDSNPVALPSEQHIPVATYVPAWRPPGRGPTNGPRKTSFIGRMLRRKRTNPEVSRYAGAGAGGGDGARGRDNTPQQRWQLNSPGVNQPTSQYYTGGAVRNNYNMEVNNIPINNNFYYDKNALFGQNGLKSATPQHQEQQQQQQHVVKPISSHHAGHVAAKYFRKLDLEEELQVLYRPSRHLQFID